MTESELTELHDLCAGNENHDISEWEIGDVYKSLRRFHALVPTLLAERELTRGGLQQLANRLDGLSGRAVQMTDLLAICSRGARSRVDRGSPAAAQLCWCSVDPVSIAGIK